MVHTLADSLLARLDNCTAVIGVIGLGHMGLPLSTAAAEAGLKTMGFDVDEGQPKTLHARASCYRNAQCAGVAWANRTGRQSVTSRKAASAR